MKIGKQWFLKNKTLNCGWNHFCPNPTQVMTERDNTRLQKEIQQDKLALKINSFKKVAFLVLFVTSVLITILTAIFWEFFLEQLPEYLIAGPLLLIISAILSIIGYRLSRRKFKAISHRIKRKKHMLSKNDETDVLFENVFKK